MYKSIDLTDIIDEEDVLDLMEYYNIEQDENELFSEIDFKKLTVFEIDAIKVFLEKFKWVPLPDLEEFLNKYRL